MVENIIEVVKDIQGWTLTLILMLLVFSDTFLALKTRVPIKQFLPSELEEKTRRFDEKKVK